jgi:hypothetical protein
MPLTDHTTNRSLIKRIVCQVQCIVVLTVLFSGAEHPLAEKRNDRPASPWLWFWANKQRKSIQSKTRPRYKGHVDAQLE